MITTPPPKATASTLRKYAETCQRESERMTQCGRHNASQIFREMAEHFEKLASNTSFKKY